MTEADREKAIQEGLAIQELQRQLGWKILLDHIQTEVDRAMLEMRNMELQGKSLQDIGVEYVSQVKLIEGLDKVKAIVRDIENRRESATL